MSGIEIIGQWNRGRFSPSDAAQLEYAERSLLPGKDIRAVFTYPRNGKQHRLYWALMSIVASNSESFSTPEKASIATKILTGHCEPIVIEGSIHWHPKSISYAAMSQAEFMPFFDEAINVVATKLIPGTAPQHIKQQIFEMTGLRP